MSDDEAMRNHSTHDEQGRPSDADLIELVLAQGGTDDVLADLDAEGQARAVELRVFLARCRGALSEEAVSREDRTDPGARVEALAARVLAATTREDLSWRGDLRLVGSFVVERLRSSRMLRIAAVVLAMHFVGLSVLAYHILRQPSELYLNIDFEKRPVLPYPEELLEPSGELPLPEAGEEPRVRELGAEGAGTGPERER